MLSIKLISVFLTLGFAQAQTSPTPTANTIPLFIDNMNPNAAWAASIQGACNGSTTYVISCTSAPQNEDCSPQTATITEGSDFYLVTTPAVYSETSGTFTETCSLNSADSSASCRATIVANQYGNDVTTTISYNLTGTNFYQYQVAITAGAHHTANGDVCPRHISGAPSLRFGNGLQGVAVTASALLVGIFGVLAL